MLEIFKTRSQILSQIKNALRNISPTFQSKSPNLINIRPSVLSVCLSVCPSVCPSVRPSVRTFSWFGLPQTFPSLQAAGHRGRPHARGCSRWETCLLRFIETVDTSSLPSFSYLT